MGALSDALARILPERKQGDATLTVPTWQSGVPQYQREPYSHYALEGYSGNEIVYAVIEELATSAAEPRIAAYLKGGDDPEKIPSHPILDLLERPNPHMDRFYFWAAVIMYLSIAGNSYIHKTRDRAGRVFELWPLRPDRVRVIPDRQRFISGYQYQIGAEFTVIDARDIIHHRYRNPMDDYYGLPPLAPGARRVDTDNWAREFTRSFFANAGVPAGLLNIKTAASREQKEYLQAMFQRQHGSGNWHRLMVLDGSEASYTQMGMPLGDSGIILPELDEINEVRIAQAFGVPLELIGARIGMLHGNRSTMKEARASFWDETLIPLYAMLAAKLNNDLVPDFEGVDYVEFDTATVGALQEDQDAKHKRLRDDMLAGGITLEEFREAIGKEPEVDPAHTFMIAVNVQRVPANEPITPSAAPAIGPDGLPLPPVPPAGKMAKTPLRVGSVAEIEALFGQRQEALGIGGGNGNGNHP